LIKEFSFRMVHWRLFVMVAWAPLAFGIFLHVGGIRDLSLTGLVIIAASCLPLMWLACKSYDLYLDDRDLTVQGGRLSRSVRFQDIGEVEFHGNDVRIRTREGTGWWRRLRFGLGNGRFLLEGDVHAFAAEIGHRLGRTERIPLPDGGFVLRRRNEMESSI